MTLFSSYYDNEEVSDCDFINNVYETYGKTMWKYAYKLSKNYDTANDIISISFVNIIEKVSIIKKYEITS